MIRAVFLRLGQSALVALVWGPLLFIGGIVLGA
jgi:hypothetical protein